MKIKKILVQSAMSAALVMGMNVNQGAASCPTEYPAAGTTNYTDAGAEHDCLASLPLINTNMALAKSFVQHACKKGVMGWTSINKPYVEDALCNEVAPATVCYDALAACKGAVCVKKVKSTVCKGKLAAIEFTAEGATPAETIDCTADYTPATPNTEEHVEAAIGQCLNSKASILQNINFATSFVDHNCTKKAGYVYGNYWEAQNRLVTKAECTTIGAFVDCNESYAACNGNKTCLSKLKVTCMGKLPATAPAAAPAAAQ